MLWRLVHSFGTQEWPVQFGAVAPIWVRENGVGGADSCLDIKPEGNQVLKRTTCIWFRITHGTIESLRVSFAVWFIAFFNSW